MIAKKDQTPDAPIETIIDGEGKKDEQKYDALGQCTRVITKLDELLLHMRLATERAHATNTSNATPGLASSCTAWCCY